MCTRIIEAMSGINLRLKKFDPSKMADDSVSVFIARCRSGKSVLIKDIMSHKKHIPAGIVLSGTEEGNGSTVISSRLCSSITTTIARRSID